MEIPRSLTKNNLKILTTTYFIFEEKVLPGLNAIWKYTACDF